VDAERFDAFTRHLVDFAEGNDAIAGLVAVGSMAAIDRQPDEWSDHDLWLIAADPEPFRRDQSWLPEPERIVLAYAETEHGANVIYDDGHLIEYAVFTPEEMGSIYANTHRVLVDKTDVTQRMASVVERTEGRPAPDDATVFGRFIGQLVIGLSRHGRGEILSAQSMVGKWAVENLLTLLARHVEPEVGLDLDNLDPRRRFDPAYPTLSAQIGEAACSPTPQAARNLLAIAGDHLQGVTGNTPKVHAALDALIERAGQPT